MSEEFIVKIRRDTLINVYLLVIPETSTVRICSWGAGALVAGQLDNQHQKVKHN